MPVSMTAEKIDFTFEIEKNTKEQFERLCSGIGISVPIAINALLKQAIKQKNVDIAPFDENGFTLEESEELKRRIACMESGDYEVHDLIEV